MQQWARKGVGISLALLRRMPLLAILALFWFMVIRPQQRRQREVTSLQNSIQVGQRVPGACHHAANSKPLRKAGTAPIA